MFDYLRTNHEICLHIMVRAAQLKDNEAERLARFAERFAFSALMNAIDGMAARPALQISLDSLKKSITMLNANHGISIPLIEEFKLEEYNKE